MTPCIPIPRHYFSAAELIAGFRARTFSPIEVIDECLARIQDTSTYGAFFTVVAEGARNEAVASERRYAARRPLPLDGVPFAAKDNISSKGVRTTVGSSMFEEHVPDVDAQILTLAREAGAILVGKTQMHEFAWGATSINHRMGSSTNPWVHDRVPGGSSGGSAVALALGTVPLALGTDTGGSVRIPAAYCGIAGMKPTWGRIDPSGVFPLAPSLDHVGAMARCPADIELFLRSIGAVEVDSDSHLRDISQFSFGVLDEYSIPLSVDVQSALARLLSTLRDLGAAVRSIRAPELDEAYDSFGVIQRAEALRTHKLKALYPQRADEYGADVLGRLKSAESVSLHMHLDATIQRQRLCTAFARVFSEIDILVTPVSAGAPPPIGAEIVDHCGSRIDARDLVMGFTVPQNLAGIPACSVPAGLDTLGLPIGMQFTGPRWADSRVLAASSAFHSAAPALPSPPLM